MKQPFFSIITSTYNSEVHLPQTIASIREQGFEDYEHIFVDAFSTDGTLKIIEDYQKDDSRVKLVQAEPKGISNAMNVGIEHASGIVIHHLHSDDFYHSSGSLQAVHDLFSQDKKLTMLIGLCSRIIDGEQHSGLLPESTFQRRKTLLRYMIHLNCYIAHPSTFIKKEVFDRHGVFDESYRYSMDYELWLRILHKERFKMINQELAAFRHGANSSDLEKGQIDDDRARKEHSKGFRAFVANTFLKGPIASRERRNAEKGTIRF